MGAFFPLIEASCRVGFLVGIERGVGIVEVRGPSRMDARCFGSSHAGNRKCWNTPLANKRGKLCDILFVMKAEALPS